MHKYNGIYKWSHFPHESKSNLRKGNATGTIFNYLDENGQTHLIQMIAYEGIYANIVEEYYSDEDHGDLFFDFDKKTVEKSSEASASIRLSEISSMSPEDQKATIQKLLQQACNPTETELAAQLQAVNAEIAHYESKYGIPSSELRQKLQSGQLQETHEICSWLMLLNAHDASEANPYSPGSAEYKALERLRNPCGEDEEIMFDPSVPKDNEILQSIARLKNRGHKIDLDNATNKDLRRLAQVIDEEILGNKASAALKDRHSKANPSEANPYSLGSAEYKALERLRNPCGEDEWVVLVDEGDEVDLDEAIARLKARGYDF